MSLKERFVQETLREEGGRMLKRQGEAMQSSVRFHTNALYAHRSVSVSGGDADGILVFTHTLHERFLDMKSLRHGSVTVKRNRLRRIHNRFVWGMYARVARKLMIGYTDEMKASFQNMTKEK